MSVRQATTRRPRPNPIALLVGTNIRAAREEAGLKQRELARALDCETARVSEWENGYHRPNDGTLVRIAERLRREYVWFFTDHSTEAAA